MNLCIRCTLAVYRVGFACLRFLNKLITNEVKEVPVMRNHVTPPWLWIGIELYDGTIIDRTEEVQNLLDRGFPVTLESIDDSVNVENVKRYFYLDTKTLNEEEFPPEGLLINDTRN
jgi:hypothetical protein